MAHSVATRYTLSAIRKLVRLMRPGTRVLATVAVIATVAVSAGVVWAEVAKDTVSWLDKTGRTIGSSGPVGQVQRELPMSLESARAEATAFVAARYPDFDQLGEPIEIKISEDAYIFAWDERSDEGVRLGRGASVQVNLTTGGISGYSAKYDRPQVPSLVPVIDEEEIRASFVKDPAHELDTIKAVGLEVREDANGSGRLVWAVDYRVGLKCPDGRVVESTGMMRYFDATTGEDVTAEVF